MGLAKFVSPRLRSRPFSCIACLRSSAWLIVVFGSRQDRTRTESRPEYGPKQNMASKQVNASVPAADRVGPHQTNLQSTPPPRRTGVAEYDTDDDEQGENGSSPA